jgi:hypothetical protein
MKEFREHRLCSQCVRENLPVTYSTGSSDAPSSLGRFRALVMGEPVHQAELDAVEGDEQFTGRVRALARAFDLPLQDEELCAAIRPEPAGLARWLDPPHSGSSLPGLDWLPVHVALTPAGVFMDWARFGEVDVGTSFFEDAIRQALRRPFNRMFRYRMRLEDVVAALDDASCRAPSGLIFHMSRCGSTLVHRMLGALPAATAISEPAPLDAVVTLCRASSLPLTEQVPYLRAMVGALDGGRKQGPYFLKLDSWHTLALPLFRAAFPDVPWIFLYRDPAEVLASQLRERGLQTVPDPRSAALYGIAGYDRMPSEEYCARVLAAICGAALGHLEAPEALLVNYAEIPGAVADRILPHFGIELGEQQRLNLAERAHYDAKTPSMGYGGSDKAAAAPLRALAECHLGDIFRSLERARASQ